MPERRADSEVSCRSSREDGRAASSLTELHPPLWAPTMMLLQHAQHGHHLYLRLDRHASRSREGGLVASSPQDPRLPVWREPCPSRRLKTSLAPFGEATPKGVLKLMKVDGLTIYHVKSHLQKYRHAKYIPEIEEDKKASSDVKRVQASSSGSDPCKNKCKGNCSVPKYLQRILEEQQKAGSGRSLSLKTPTEPSESTSRGRTKPEAATVSSPQPSTTTSRAAPDRHGAWLAGGHEGSQGSWPE
ncbi:hypothetical protein QYE76_035425 [Lolium multiflorum]|uniref:HTH myb-type domain-containing protein n=1 Tax=Lolium multiflorum TaxID=4521 RepID=A0AAD8R004_LOLMU|nr:hypothetical protein QYE76_035425 [Lolium multiflorum]